MIDRQLALIAVISDAGKKFALQKDFDRVEICFTLIGLIARNPNYFPSGSTLKSIGVTNF